MREISYGDVWIFQAETLAGETAQGEPNRRTQSPQLPLASP